MVINFNKNIDTNIQSIKVSGGDYEIVNVVTGGTMGWTIDADTNTIAFIGSTDVQVSFNNADNLQLYVDQIEAATSKPWNPFSQGLATDPHYDKIPTGNIVPHTYVNTDIEQDAINGN